MKSDSAYKMQVAVTVLPKLNSMLCLPLIECCGGIENFFSESPVAFEALCREFNVCPDTFDRKTALKKAEEELPYLEKQDIRICSVEDYYYPELLKQCEDTPLVFFYKGELITQEKVKYLAIVGTRKASVLCQSRVESVVETISALPSPVVIVSGLAYGIDAAAHRASLKYNLKTYAVLGHGLHMIYPAAHKNLAEKILEQGGALISEFPCSADIHPSNFLQRNRIVAGLCHATLIAESAQKGGAMSTARIALSYNRDVMAFPGRPEDKMSAGCNLLIKENVAALTENGQDVAIVLGLSDAPVCSRQQTLDLFYTENQERLIFECLEKENDLGIDDLARLTGIPSGELAATLLKLELEGKILSLPGKKYAKM